MNDRDEQQAEDLLDRAAEALCEAPVPEGPSQELVASTVEALRAASNAPDALRPNPRRTPMSRVARYALPAAAAAALIAFAVGSFLVTGGGGAAFAQVIEKVKKAEGVRFLLTQKLGTGRPALSGFYYVQGNAARMEFPGMMVMIADFQKKQVVQLDLVRKVAHRTSIDDKAARQFAQTLANPVETFRKLKGDEAEKLGERIVAARKVDAYRLKKFEILGIRADATKSNDAQLTVLVDQETGLPVRIMLEASSHVEGKSDDWFIFDEFTWDRKLDPKLFSLEIPEGFQVMEAPADPSSQPQPGPKGPGGS